MHRRLDVWNLSVGFVTEIYRCTQKFPDFEKFGLGQQLRRAAVSIPSNIAEGAARQTEKEFLQFLHIALGSCAEVETQLIIARNLGYSVSDGYFETIARIKKMLMGLIRKRR